MLENLAHYTGSESMSRFNLWGDYLTEGAKYVADEAGAYWLMDDSAIYLRTMKYVAKTGDTFAVINLKKKSDDGWLFEITDGNGKRFTKANIEFSTFPRETFQLYAKWDGSHWMIMLPSEY